MLTKALNALFLMIAAVLVFISIQDPYTIELKASLADEKNLITKELNAQILGEKNALVSANEYFKSVQKDEARGLKIASDKLKIYAKKASKNKDEIYFQEDVRMLYYDILLLTKAAKMNTSNRKIASDEKVYAFKDDWRLQADSLSYENDELELKGVHLWQE